MLQKLEDERERLPVEFLERPAFYRYDEPPQLGEVEGACTPPF